MFSFARFNPFRLIAAWRMPKRGPAKTGSAGTSTAEKTHNPFYDEIFRLASERGSGFVQNEEEARIRENVSELVKDMPKASFSQPISDAPTIPPSSNTIPPGAVRPRRQADGTTVDLKSWWGQSVSTWDAADGKNVNMADKNRTQRPNRWTANPNSKFYE